MTDTTDLVTKLLSEGAKEFPHQWGGWASHCRQCGAARQSTSTKGECPVLLRIALDLTRQQLAEALDPTVRE